MRGLDGITDAVGMNLGKLWEMGETERPGMLQSMGSQKVRHDCATEHHHKEGYYQSTIIS